MPFNTNFMERAHHFLFYPAITKVSADFSSHKASRPVGGTGFGVKEAVRPTLGLSWSNCVNSRILLTRREVPRQIYQTNEEGEEVATHVSCWRRDLSLLFSSYLPSDASCSYVVEQKGVRGIENTGF